MSRSGINKNDPISILTGLKDIDMFSMINKKHKQNIIERNHVSIHST